ncbi:MAG: signal peptidase I [Actinomycetaceae bacterium]|nr:signal peptidase I [Arcanobacterium sp.]MDD7686731.1 signal peptidase I [Actinomycetaceae bacterium]MDY5272591.1 signal peptidase I [Arcanobacterium sp.]
MDREDAAPSSADSADDRFAQEPEVMPPSFAPTPARRRRREAERDAQMRRATESPATPLLDGEQQPRRSFLVNLLQWVSLVAVGVLIAVIVKTFFIQSFVIPSGSMETTLMPGDRIYVNKLANEADELHRGDVVVFRDPGGWLAGVQQPQQSPAAQVLTKVGETVGLVPSDVGTHLVKRIIGVGGDHVICCTDTGQITVNGLAISEPYVRAGVNPSDVPFDVTVPKGYLWVMGDNRSNSQDSRYHQQKTGFGFVPVSNVEGRAWLIFYPFDRFGWIASGESAFAQVPSNAQ